MSAKVKILAPVTNKDSLLDTLNQLNKVDDIRDRADRIVFRLKGIDGNHVFQLENDKWCLNYEDFHREGNGKVMGKKFLDEFMPLYNRIQEERHAEELRQLVLKKEEEIKAKAKANNYRVIRKEEQGKIKLVLIKAK